MPRCGSTSARRDGRSLQIGTWIQWGGFELLCLLAVDEGLETIFFIIVMAETNFETRMAALKAQVGNLVAKPFNSESLTDNIDEACAGQGVGLFSWAT